jgi:hypothetical protein
MQAIVPHVRSRNQPYAWGCIEVNPDPPRVGEVTRITFPLHNSGPDDQTIERIDVMVAQFGMGLRWEELPPIGPIALPADPVHDVMASVEWTPTVGGHRCVRGRIHVAGAADPFTVGRNLHVIEADAAEDVWRVPFALGNPEPRRAPIQIRLGGNHLAAVEAAIRVAGQAVPFEQPVWLEPGEEVEAELLLRARLDGALNHIRTVEAWIHGRLIDGIHVTIHRPAVADATATLGATMRQPVATSVQ